MIETARRRHARVHRDTIVVAVTAIGDVGKATPYGTFPNTAAALEKLVKRLRQAGSGPLKFCYEAGPCGYGVHRNLTKMGENCIVVAPSMIPRKAGERQKNDKRDAASLAVLHRGGLLTAVWVPDAAHEAMRDLIRARLAAVRTVRTARQHLSAFLLRHERVYPAGRTAWTKAHRGWLADQCFAQPAQQIVLEENIEAVRLGEQRRDRIDGYLRAQIPTWSLFPLVQNLSALRGLDTIASAGLARGHGRSVTLCVSTRLHGLSRFGAVGTFLRPEAQHRRHYQNRRRSRPLPADRSRSQLSLPGPHRSPQADHRRCRARRSARDRLESANPALPALSSHDGEGQVEPGRGHRDCARAGRIRLVYRLHHDGSTGKELCHNDCIRKDLPNWVNRPLQHAA